MTCRRKTKTERELVADIHKTFRVFCQKRECWECPYGYSHNCKQDYVLDLLAKSYEDEEDEE